MKLLYIEWEDACGADGWHTKEEFEKFINEGSCIIRQVGWLYEENKKHIVLASRLGDNIFDGRPDAFGHLQKIPKTWIRKRKDLTKWIKSLGK